VREPFRAHVIGEFLLFAFHRLYPDIKVSDPKLPVIAVVNRGQTNLKLVKGLSLDGEMEKRLDAMINMTHDPEVTIN
jgi:hypothetical protein